MPTSTNAGVSPPCTHCGSTFTTVIDKRGESNYNKGDIYRRRECLDCGGRISTWEISRELYEGVRENHRLRAKGVKMFNELKHNTTLDRFQNLGIIDREAEIAEIWNDPTFVKGLHYGAMLALREIFKIRQEDLW